MQHEEAEVDVMSQSMQHEEAEEDVMTRACSMKKQK